MWGEKKTKIVATLSDFRANEEFVRGLFEAGMDVVRINSAHVTEEGAAKIVEAVRRVNPAIPVLLDTKGPEIRVTAVADEYGGAIGFQTGERVKVRGTADGEPSTRDTIYFNVATVVRDIAVGARLLIADGELELRVTDKTDEELMCEFVRGGTLRSRKSVNVPGMKIDLPSVTEKDRRFIEWAVKNDVDFIAHSFVRSARDIRAVQDILDAHGSNIKIISKIENQEGLDNIDEIIHIIRAAKNPDLAKQAMMERFSLSDAQASAIIEMRLRALTGLEHDKLVAERNELEAQIAYFNDVLGSRELQMKIVKDELLEVKAKYGDERRSEIVYASEEFNPEDFYADDEMVITISHLGYIKRTPLAEYRTQNRGGVGAKGSATRDEDFIEHIYMATMHNTMLFFTEKGRCYWLKVYEIPEGTRSSKGRAIQNVIQIEPDDKVRAYINVKRLDDAEYVNNNYIIMCTKDGTIKKTKLEAYSRPRQNGVNAIVIREGDQLIEAKLTSGNAEVMIAAREGKAIRFNENTVRPIGRVGAGVRGISLDEGDEVVGMICIEPNSSQDVLVLSENGYGKRTDLDEYRITNRGGKGVKTINITEKTGKLISIQAVTDENDLMIINRSGLTIRTAVDQIRVAGRATQGVRIINLREGDAIASVIAVPANEEEEPAVLDGAGAPESESEENVSKEQ